LISADALEKFRKYLRYKEAVVAAYLFGSAVLDRDRVGSDIDIAVMVRGKMAGLERVQLETELSNLLERDVDLVVFGSASPLLQHQILKYGRIIYEADSRVRVRQEVASRIDYLDSLFLYKVLEDRSHGG